MKGDGEKRGREKSMCLGNQWRMAQLLGTLQGIEIRNGAANTQTGTHTGLHLEMLI